MSALLQGLLLRTPSPAVLERYEISADKDIPFQVLVDDRTIRTQEGDFIRTYYVTGVPFECVEDDMLNAFHNALNHTIRVVNGIADGRLTFYTHLVRRRSGESPRRKFEPGYPDDLNRRYAENLADIQLHESTHYLSVVYRMSDGGVGPLSARSTKMTPAQLQEEDAIALEDFDEVTRALEAGLKHFKLQSLTTYDLKGNVFSEQLELYNYIANGFDQRVPLTHDNICDTLLAARPIFRHTLGVIHGDDSVYVAALGIEEYPMSSGPGHLDDLLALPFEFVFTQSFALLPREKAKKMMKLYGIHLEQTEDDAGSQVEEITRRGEGGALNDLTARKFDMGMYHGSLVVKGANAEEVNLNLAKARGVLSDGGFIAKREWLGLAAAWWSQLPGNMKLNPRQVPITSLNWCGLTSFHRYMRGKRSGNHWGESVAMLRTASGDPYDYNFHVADVGNALVVGPIGSGKTVFLTFLALHLKQFAAKGIVFDYKRGMEIGIRAAKGDYFVLKNGEKTGFNPFQLDGTSENIEFLKVLLQSMLEDDGGPPLTVKESMQLGDAITSVFRLPKASRRINKLSESINIDEQLGQRLSQWFGEGSKAWLFDNEVDDIDFRPDQLTGFDMTQFIENKGIRRPLMMYLFYRMQLLIGQGRMFTIIDEFWRALDDEFFVTEFKKRTKTTRSQNWFFIVATQSAADAVGSVIFPTILDGFATKVFLPNPSAKMKEYVNGFELTEAEFMTIKSLPLNSHLVFIKQGDVSGVVLLDLAGMDDDLAVLSSSAEHTLLVEEIIADVGSDPELWLPIFHRRRKKKG